MYRLEPDGSLSFFLAHMGGPYFARKDAGAWTIPKGLASGEEALFTCARREFEEETGLRPPDDTDAYTPLGAVTQSGGKTVHAWAFRGDWAHGRAPRSNTFTLEWPPHSGRSQSFPEIDRVAFFPYEQAVSRIVPAQRDLLDRLRARLEAP